MNDCTIKLIGATYQNDAYGVPRATPSSREVFAQVRSVTRAEFFDGGRSGLNPELQFTMFAGDYNGELIVEYNGNRYSVYRTYIADGDYLELYVERKGGTNGTQEVETDKSDQP